MEFLVGVGVSIVTEIGKYSVKPIIRHVGYLFNFKKKVDDLGKAKNDLISNQEQVQTKVEQAALNTEVVNNNVEAWLNNVEEVVKDVETLENKIKANKGCFNWIQRYKQSKEVVEKTITVKQLKDVGNFTHVAHRAPTPGLEIFSSSDFEEFESRKLAFGQIMEALEDNNCSRIGVWGLGGVGKTTLVKQVYKKAKELNLFNDTVMAVVSQPPDIIQIQKEIADCLNLELKEESATGKARRICMKIKKVEKILIILDDIWEEVNLEDIGIPSHHDHKGCKILITTRSVHVCNVMSCEKKVPVEVISEEESLALFKKSACINDDSIVINDDVVGEVVKECQGLPIAIVVVGKALIKKSLNDWKAALQQLRNSKLVDIEGVNVNKNAYVCLKWSYDRLKQNTKLCFLLCSLFPEDYKIPIEELTRYAIGMEVYDDVMEIEERRRLVCSSINALKDSSLLLADEEKYRLLDGGQKYVKMHDMVRDVALWIASKGEEEVSLRTCTRLENIKNIENAMAISLWANNTKLPDKLVCSKLNILSLGEIPRYWYQLENFLEISDTLFEGMKGLKVLSLRNKFLSSQSLQFLTNLRCLYLVTCNFDDLSSLGKLKSLEILSFCSCRMVALPNELGELNNLKVLDLLNCSQLKISPNLIQSLSQLKELYVSNSSSVWESIETASIFSLLEELRPVSNLVVLSFAFHVNNLPNAFVFPKLQRYDISITGVSNMHLTIKDYPESRTLRIKKVNASSLNAFKELFYNVEELCIERSEVECITDATGGNNLVSLRLYEMPSLRTLWDCNIMPIHHTTFRNLITLRLGDCNILTNLFSPLLVQNLEKLKFLYLRGCSELKQIISEEEMLFKFHHTQLPCFPKLKNLTVSDCRKLEYLFSISVARGFLLQLEELVIEDLPELKQVFRDEGKVDVGLDGDKLELSKLRKLSLKNLPKMSSFCQANISSTWPSLESLLVMSCPKMTSFIVNLEANVRAVGKRYVISIGSYSEMSYSESRVLRFANVDASSMNVFKVFLYTVEVLELEKCEVECITDATGGNNTFTFSNLVKLILNDMPSLRTMWEGAIQQTTFRNLTVLEVKGCSRLTNLFSSSIVQNLEKLETLIFEKCSELKQIISEDEILFNCHIQSACFPKLRILKVIDCRKLEYLFSISIARGFLLQLEELKIEDLPALKQVFGNEREGEVGLDENKFELSKMRKLSLKNFPKLSMFFRGNISSTWPSLERLSMMSCPKLMSSFLADLEAGLQAVEKKYVICIGGYFEYFEEENSKSRFLGVVDADASLLDALRVLFYTVEVLDFEKCEVECFIDTTGGNNTVTFSNLVVLILKDMPSLRTMWEGPIQQTTFHNLIVLEVRSCNRLSNLFSLSLVQNLKKLETLILENCHELKQIISEEEMLLKCHHIQPPCFPNLRILKVIDCGKLEYLFSTTVARGLLLQLKELTIKDLPELKQVFRNKREGEVGLDLDGNKFELSKLSKLSLENLPKLSNFFQGNISSTWPSLERLSMISCPKLRSSFVADLVVSLHAVEKYVIRIGGYFEYFEEYNSKSRFLGVVDADTSLLDALKVLFYTIEVLKLEKCEVECFIDTTEGNNTITFSNLVELILKDMPCLRTMWEGPIQQTTFRNLTVLEVRSCSRLSNLFSLSLVQNLEKLETLILENCHELKQIISEEEKLLKCHHIQPPCFPKLRILEVIGCGKLEYLFSISVARCFLLQLEKLMIKDLLELKQVFCNEREGEVGLDGNKFELSELRELCLENLPKLSNFFQGNISSTWPSLERLSMISCPKLTSSFVDDLEANVPVVEKKLQVLNVSNCSRLCNTVLDLLTKGLLDLEELKIESCGGLEDLFQRERLLPSRLKILSLKDLLIQRCVWKGPTQLVYFNNLKKFEVCRCNRLRQLFSPATLSQSLQQLEYLRIEECEELEHLIAEDEEDHILAEGHLQPLYFSKLSNVIIKECNKMKSLLPITIAHNLRQLESLEVEIASQLVEVFAHENEGDVGVRKDIRLPNLWNLSLKCLSSLVGFCPRNYHFILSSLSCLQVLSCPNIVTSFARSPYSRTIVHVNGKVPQLDEKDEHAVLSATSQVVATSKDIDWSWRHAKIDALPLFKEEP